MKKELRQKELITPEDCFSLKGKNAVIFGGAGKMAESFSRTLLTANAKSLTLFDRKQSRLTKVVHHLTKEFPAKTIRGEMCDASGEAEVKAAVRSLKIRTKKIDVLIYAVMSKPKDYYAPLPQYHQKTWDEALSGNLSGAFLVTQKLIPLMNRSASIIYISSTYGIVAPDFRIYKKVKSNIYGGKYPLTLPAVYSASKAGLIGLTKYMAVYLAGRNIRVNSLVPGGVYDHQDENFYGEYVKRVPLGRMAAWTDYNGPILFLAADASRYMTGQVLVIDGGYSIL